MNILLQLAQYTSDYSSYSSSYDSSAAAGAGAALALSGAVLVATIIFGLIAAVISYVITAIFTSKIFKKAGIEGWIAWVPIYNQWKLLEIGGQHGFWAPLLLVPVVNYVSIVFLYISMYNIGLKLGKSGGFVALAIFLPIVWIIWLALDKSVWNESLGKPSLAVRNTAPAAAGAAAPSFTPPATTPEATPVVAPVETTETPAKEEPTQTPPATPSV